MTILTGILVGILICLVVPPKELATRFLKGMLTVCKFLTEKGQEHLKKLEEEEQEDAEA
jgi:hypothetical protein